MKAFRVKKNGKTFDYRVGQELDLGPIADFFSQNYNVEKIWQEKRHVAVWVESPPAGGGKKFFAKLSTTEGISIRSETEKVWNEEFNKYSTSQKFLVPKNLEDGHFNGLYYLVMDRFDGPFVCDLEGKNNLIKQNIDNIISLSEHIQNLPLDIPINDAIKNSDHREWFKLKTRSWFDGIPQEVVQKYGVSDLWQVVEEGAKDLSEKPRHGDFAPWHIMVLGDNKLGLIDGEHSHSHGVENYDISYFIQRVHTVLNRPDLAIKIFQNLLKRGYDKEKLRTVLASRAIGGFLDQSFKQNPSYEKENDFKNWVLSI